MKKRGPPWHGGDEDDSDGGGGSESEEDARGGGGGGGKAARGWEPDEDETAQLVYWLRNLGEFVSAKEWTLDGAARHLAIRIVDMHTRTDDFRPKQGTLAKLFKGLVHLEEDARTLIIRPWLARLLGAADKLDYSGAGELWAAPDPKRAYEYKTLSGTPEKRIEDLEAALALVPASHQKAFCRTTEWFELLEAYIARSDTRLLDYLLEKHPPIWVELRIVFGAQRCAVKKKRPAPSPVPVSLTPAHDGGQVKTEDGERASAKDCEKGSAATKTPPKDPSGTDEKAAGDDVPSVVGTQSDKDEAPPPEEAPQEDGSKNPQTLAAVLLSCHPRARPGEGIIPADAQQRHEQGLWPTLATDVEAVSRFLSELDKARLDAALVEALHSRTLDVVDGNFDFIENKWESLNAVMHPSDLPKVAHWQRLSIGFAPNEDWWCQKLRQVSDALVQLDALDVGQTHTSLLRGDRIAWLQEVLFKDPAPSQSALAEEYRERALNTAHLHMLSTVLDPAEMEPLHVKALRHGVPVSRLVPAAKSRRLLAILFGVAKGLVAKLEVSENKASLVPFVARMLDRGDPVSVASVEEATTQMRRVVRNRIRKLRDGALVEAAEEVVSGTEGWAEPSAEIRIVYRCANDDLLNAKELAAFLSRDAREMDVESSASRSRPSTTKVTDETNAVLPAIWAGLEVLEAPEQPQDAETAEPLLTAQDIVSVALTKETRVISTFRNGDLGRPILRKYPARIRWRECLILEEIFFLQAMLSSTS